MQRPLTLALVLSLACAPLLAHAAGPPGRRPSAAGAIKSKAGLRSPARAPVPLIRPALSDKMQMPASAAPKAAAPKALPHAYFEKRSALRYEIRKQESYRTAIRDVDAFGALYALLGNLPALALLLPTPIVPASMEPFVLGISVAYTAAIGYIWAGVRLAVTRLQKEAPARLREARDALAELDRSWGVVPDRDGNVPFAQANAR
jgi:hypothetical protein